MCMYIYIYVSMRCVYIYIYTHIHMYIYTLYIYVHDITLVYTALDERAGGGVEVVSDGGHSMSDIASGPFQQMEDPPYSPLGKGQMGSALMGSLQISCF